MIEKRSPQTHSVSGMFCPACDARIGYANVCKCGASHLNGWISNLERELDDRLATWIGRGRQFMVAA